jgi:hypothetical protein
MATSSFSPVGRRSGGGAMRFQSKTKTTIYCGLISGDTAKLAAFAGKERLDKMNGTNGYYGKFSRLVGAVTYQDILSVRWQ